LTYLNKKRLITFRFPVSEQIGVSDACVNTVYRGGERASSLLVPLREWGGGGATRAALWGAIAAWTRRSDRVPVARSGARPNADHHECEALLPAASGKRI